MGNQLLITRLMDLIRKSGGWIPFDLFMAEALYAPGLGYYSGSVNPIGRMPGDGSDFVTAPEVSPLFGSCLAKQIGQALSATGTHTIFEFGAGTGALAEQLLSSLPATIADGADVQYNIVDVSESLRKAQKQRLSRFGSRVNWLSELPPSMEGVVLGNELLDAIPVKLLYFDGTCWRERGVTIEPNAVNGSSFRWSDRESCLQPPIDHISWTPGTVTEIHPQAEAWVCSVAERLAKGALILIDYGFPDSEYYHPQRISGTLMCHFQHQSDTDPLVNIGTKDITSHVNFSAIGIAGQEAGLEVLGYTSQAHFLFNCGLAESLAEASVKDRTAAQLLFLEHEMGELFKVIAFVTPQHHFDAIGFTHGDRSHRL
ncbi:MAG: class I SAM-dependent methyltransferase [Burkholderiales bacterium]